MDIIRVMLSSTTLDLPAHREAGRIAIMEQGMHPVMMESLAASPSDASSVSLKMVEESDIYLLVIGVRYGTIWTDGNSITELEYDFALRTDKKRLVFIAAEDHPFTMKDFDQDAERFEKLRRFKEKVSEPQVNVVKFFKSPEDLKSKIINSLSYVRDSIAKTSSIRPALFDLPKPPAPYIPHSYSLLDSRHLVGRKAELEVLGNWWSNSGQHDPDKPFLLFISIGGMGKSALTWSWFNQVIQRNEHAVDGYIWWSFYETDASFSNFVIHALAYITGHSIADIEREDFKRREEALIQALVRLNYLIVFDGIERILLAYSRLDAAKLSEEGLDERANNVLHPFYSTKPINEKADPNLRRFSDIRATLFFSKLINNPIRSKLLISSRLLPSVFDSNDFGEYTPACVIYKLGGLSNPDALELWRKYAVSGDDVSLLRLFKTFDNYPMLIRALATEIRSFREAPGDYYKWLGSNQNFDPYSLDLVQVKSHVLYYALIGLDAEVYDVLKMICAFRSPAKYEVLVSLIVGPAKESEKRKALHSALKELEERGLIGWNKSLNTYDAHPIVRGITWTFVNSGDKQGIFSSMTSLFKEMPITSNWENVSSIEDLSIPLEYYNALINLKNYAQAYEIFYDKLNNATNYKLNSNQLRISLLEVFFDDDHQSFCYLGDEFAIAFVYNSLALSYDCVGDLKRSDVTYTNLLEFQKKRLPRTRNNYYISLLNYSDCLINQGKLYQAELNLRMAVKFFQESSRDYEAIALGKFARLLNLKGDVRGAEQAYLRCFELFEKGTYSHPILSIHSYYLLFCIRLKKPVAQVLKENERLLGIYNNYERHVIINKRSNIEYLISTGHLIHAGELANDALVQARNVQFVEEELSLLLILARLAMGNNDDTYYNNVIREFCEIAKTRDYRLLWADVCNLQSAYYFNTDRDRSVKFANEAILHSCYSGKSFAYQDGYSNAMELLKKSRSNPPRVNDDIGSIPDSLRNINLMMPR